MKRAWPYQNTPYLSALPGVGAPGLDISAGDKPSKMYFVTSRENKKEGGPDPRGPNCFAGTLWWCWYADQGEDFHKYIAPFEGGYAYLGKGMNTPERPNFDYIGHAAPGAGLFVQTAKMNSRGSNSRIWHMPSWVGDLPSAGGPDEFKADQRDALGSDSVETELRKVAFINCEARFSMDEAISIWYDSLGVSLIRSAVYDPLHMPPGFAMPEGSHHEEGTDHGYGPLIGGRADYSLCMQSLFAHTTDRNPLVSAPNHAHINNLHYNHGRPYIGRGEALNIDDNGDHNADAGLAMQCNCVGNVTVRGPEQGDALTLARVGNVTPGSSGYSAANSCSGWPNPTSQAGFFYSHPDDYLRSTVRPSAWPRGLGSNLAGVLQPCADPLNPRTQELLEFSQLMRETVGCMPSRRYLYKGGLNRVLDQIDAAIRGVVSDRQYINSVNDLGGWEDVPTASVDPLDPGKEWHAPMPLGADRDDVMDSGILLDGSSAAGLTRIRCWVINEYFNKQGR